MPEKTTCCQSFCQTLCLRSHCRRRRRWIAVRRILRKDTLTRSAGYSRRQRIDEVHISILIALDQHASNYLEEAVRSLTAVRSRCRSSRADVSFHRYSQFSSCSVLVGSLLLSDIFASLWKYSAAHELLLLDRKILLVKGL